MLFSINPETETDPDRKPTFEQKTDPDPDQSQKVNPAGLYYVVGRHLTHATIIATVCTL
jgi:hypothetical protein